MKILIVSGFLGAGKTTFIKELIKKSKKNLVVLENEYGQNNIDSGEIDGAAGDLEILEFMEGCVCCTKKDSFSNTILAISAGMDPEYLVVEPTGVGKLSAIIDAIKKVSYEKIELLKPLAVISPGNYEMNVSQYGDIYLDQIKNAGTICFSKNESLDGEISQNIANKIREQNPNCEIIESHYSSCEDSWWESILKTSGQVEKVSIEDGSDGQDFEELSLREISFNNPGELAVLLTDILNGDFGMIPRAKGIVDIAGEMIRFDLADGRYCITGDFSGNETSQVVFIGKNLNRRGILSRLGVDGGVKNMKKIKVGK